MTAGVLLLAAGVSRRFGSDKRQALLPGGLSLLETSITAIQASGLPLQVCVAAADEMLARALLGRGIETRVCLRAGEGMGATLAEGVAGLPAWDAILVALADMPLIRPASYSQVAACASRDRICVPRRDGKRGHPVAFGAAFRDELAQCDGDHGARWVIDRHPQAIHWLDLDDPGIFLDIDTEAALRALSQT